MLPKRTALFLALVLAVALLGALVYGCRRMSQERTAEAEGDKPVVTESRVEHRTNGEAVVRLDLATQRLIGLQTAALPAATQPLAVIAYGRVVEPAPLLALASDSATN